MKRTEEHNKKISESMKGRKLSEDHKKHISDKLKGNQNAVKKVNSNV